MLSSCSTCAWKLPFQGAELFGPGIMFGLLEGGSIQLGKVL